MVGGGTWANVGKRGHNVGDRSDLNGRREDVMPQGEATFKGSLVWGCRDDAGVQEG